MQPRSVETATEQAAETAAEQAYFDLAAKHRDLRRQGLDAVAGAGANPGAAAHLRRYADAARRAVGSAEEAVAFGRIDDESDETLYLGKHLIRDDSSRVLVVNWQAPAAAPYFEASHDDARGLRRRRTFTCEANTIQDFSDVVFARIADGVDRHLLAELARDRTGTMRDIVATIQAAQYELVRAGLDQVLVIEGGPGTGKTAIALHRISWLLFNHRDTMSAADVLVVGPHPTFMRYIGTVLPGLGDAQVELRHVGQLGPDLPGGRVEPAAVSRIKGDERMAGLLARALQARVGVAEPVERLLVGGRIVSLPGASVAAAVDAARDADLPYAQRRSLFRDRLTALVHDRAGVDARGQESVANLVERLWPQQSPAAFLRDLLGSAARLRAAADGEFAAEELSALHRRGADRLSEETWSPADLPLLDELDHLINGGVRRYAHVVLDEAQDLSPMQLRSVARRCATGSMTVVGDLAQSTGPWARDGWDEVTRHLPRTQPVRVRPLRYGYRVPRQAYEMAARVLPVAAPAVRPVEVVRDGPAEPVVHRVGLAARAGRVVAVATAHAAAGQFVGIVCPPRCRREVEAALAADGVTWSNADRGELGGSVNLVSPREAKGLEFDAVVVVEPEQIVAEDERGHRLLYVALTRTTRYLDVVCHGEPLPLTVPGPPVSPDPDPDPAALFTQRQAQRLAEHLAGQVRGAAPARHWKDVLARLERMLAEPD